MLLKLTPYEKNDIVRYLEYAKNKKKEEIETKEKELIIDDINRINNILLILDKNPDKYVNLRKGGVRW